MYITRYKKKYREGEDEEEEVGSFSMIIIENRLFWKLNYQTSVRSQW
jgi:hypothetical protein